MSELILEGIEWRLATPADPRDLQTSDDNNTVIQQLQGMVDAAVEAALAKREHEAPAVRRDTIHPARDDIQYYNNNTVIQGKDAAPSDAPEAVDAQIAQHITRLEDRIHEIQHDDNITVIQESLVEAAVTPPDDIPMSDVGGTPAAARPRRGIPKLTPRQVKALRAKRAKGAKIEMLMAQYGISKATVFRYLA